MLAAKSDGMTEGENIPVRWISMCSVCTLVRELLKFERSFVMSALKYHYMNCNSGINFVLRA